MIFTAVTKLEITAPCFADPTLKSMYLQEYPVFQHVKKLNIATRQHYSTKEVFP